MENFIGCFDNVLDQEECVKIIDFFEHEVKLNNTFYRQEVSSNTVKSDESWFEYAVTENIKDKTVQASSKFDMRFPTDQFTPVKLKIMECFKEYVNKWGVLALGSRYHISPGIKIQKTNPGEGYHVWHYERSSADTVHRVAVYTIYLNDDFEAGETEFLYHSSRVKPQTGSICIFPSGFTHTHRGNPPIGNSKYIITGWIDLVSE